MFKGLCGSKNYKNVVILTTFWDKMTIIEEGVRREDQLKTDFFKELVAGGANFMRHGSCDNMETGRTVLEHVFTLLPANLQIKEEIREQGKRLEETAAGSVHSEEMKRMIAKHKEEMASLQEELETMRANHAAERQEVMEELDKLKQQLAREEQERSELRRGLDEAKESQVQLKRELAKQKVERERLKRELERGRSKSSTQSLGLDSAFIIQRLLHGLGLGSFANWISRFGLSDAEFFGLS